MVKTTKKKIDILDITRHAVGMISLEDLEETENILDKQKRIDYCKEATLVLRNRVFQNELKRIVKMQTNFIACEARTMEEVAVGRGTINCAALLEERFQHLSNEYSKETKQPDKNFNKFKII